VTRWNLSMGVAVLAIGSLLQTIAAGPAGAVGTQPIPATQGAPSPVDALGPTAGPSHVPGDPIVGGSTPGGGAESAVGNSGVGPGSSSWKVVKSANEKVHAGTIASVSCTAPAVCEAVGTYINGSGAEVPLAEAWNGMVWTVQTTPSPSDATDSYLSGVSCTAAAACEAVGYYSTKRGSVTLAEAWNGVGWSIQTTPSPTGTNQRYLSGVSCTAANACEAVGHYLSISGPELTLAEAWNGLAWTVQTTPSPTGSARSVLSGVSCTAANACEAVGDYNSSGTPRTVAEAWNGLAWSIQTTPNPSGATGSFLSGVSCTAANACEAVGDYRNAERATLAEAWNGVTWSIQTTPNPSGSARSDLYGVSCTASNACEAVGDYRDSGTARTLAEAWNGLTWSLQATPNRSGATGSSLSGVSCTAANACEAVGHYVSGAGEDTPSAEVWNGMTWNDQTISNPTGSARSVLLGVSCTAANACEAVGRYFISSGAEVPFAEAWNGLTWSLQTTPNPSGSTQSVLVGVSCAAANACEAIGFSYTNSGTVPLAEAWNGTAWTVQATPDPSGATGSYLSGVSCTAAIACEAVGYYYNGSGTLTTLAEAWNGSAWSIQTTPDPSGATESYLTGVSCTAAIACEAVGFYYHGPGPDATLAEVWDGTAWSMQTIPTPSGATYSYLYGVSCTAAIACEAVGINDTSSGTVASAEGWNGSAWSIQTTPNPSGVTNSALSGVSCTAANACEAVGTNSTSSATVTSAEVWNGTAWSTQTTPNPSGATYSSLFGVSCTAANACEAVGYYDSSIYHTLVIAGPD